MHDTKLLAATIEAIVVERPDPAQCPQHLCLDKAYDNPTGQAATEAAYEVAHTPEALRKLGGAAPVELAAEHRAKEGA